MVNLVLYCTCLFLYERFMLAHLVLIGQASACQSKDHFKGLCAALFSLYFSLSYFSFSKNLIALSEKSLIP